MELLECGHPESEHSAFTTGYGKDDKGNRSCYACCADADKAYMREHGHITLYLTEKGVTNWPGSLLFKAQVKKGKHNIAGTRYDAWFRFEGAIWHGVQYGEMTEMIHCKATKATS